VSRSQLFQGIADLLEQLAGQSPLLVIIEDLHWADRSTRDLISFLIAVLRHKPILLIATYRTSDLDGAHPLRSTLLDWFSRQSVHRIELGPLSAEHSAELVMDRMSLHRGSEMVDVVVEKGGGNPYFLEELAAAAPKIESTPAPLRELLLQRFKDLPGELFELLRIASLGGVTVDDEIVGEIAGLSTEQTLGLLRNGIDSHLLMIDKGFCRFRHALLVEVLQNDILPAERRKYHQAYADLLPRRVPPPNPGELAAHQTKAGDFDAAITNWARSARIAEDQFAFAEARSSYKAALDLWDLVAEPENLAEAGHTELTRRMAEMAFMAGDFEEATQIARRALTALKHDEDSIVRGLITARLARYLCNTPNYGEALEIQENAVELIPSEPPTSERAEVLAGLAWIYQYEGRYRLAGEVAYEALDVGNRAGSRYAIISASNTYGACIALTESLVRGLKMMREARDMANEAGDAFEETRGHWNTWANLIYGGELHAAVSAMEALIGVLPRLGFAHDIPEVLERTAGILFRLGDWDRAEELIAEARLEDPAGMRSIGLPALHIARAEYAEARELIAAKSPLSVAGLAEMHLWNVIHLAELEAAEDNHKDAMAAVGRVVNDSVGVDRPLAVGHAIALGLRIAADMADRARIKGDRVVELDAIDSGTDFHRRFEDLRASPGPPDGWKREVSALAAQIDAEFARLQDREDRSDWEKAAEAWRALSTPVDAAYCRLRMLACLPPDPSDDGLAFAELLGFARSLKSKRMELEVSRIAELRGHAVRFNPHSLTDREFEVLALLTRGATNRQIAEELFISAKTAGVHVSNILRKLDVSNRGGAAARAVDEGLIDTTTASTRR